MSENIQRPRKSVLAGLKHLLAVAAMALPASGEAQNPNGDDDFFKENSWQESFNTSYSLRVACDLIKMDVEMKKLKKELKENVPPEELHETLVDMVKNSKAFLKKLQDSHINQKAEFERLENDWKYFKGQEQEEIARGNKTKAKECAEKAKECAEKKNLLLENLTPLLAEIGNFEQFLSFLLQEEAEAELKEKLNKAQKEEAGDLLKRPVPNPKK